MSGAITTAHEWIADGRGDLPLPGRGRTAERWAALTAMARQDLPAARLVEAHADAAAIGEELNLEIKPSRADLWGVWAAEPPSPVLEAERGPHGWTLTGTKPWCSGAGSATHALVTAHHDGAPRLFSVNLDQHEISAGEMAWASPGMRATVTGPMHFDGAAAHPAGEPASYLDRAGFWHGGIGVAACWWGGAQGLIDVLRRKAQRRNDPHTLAHLGACLAWDQVITGAMESAAREVDAGPEALPAAKRRAYAVRSMAERGCSDVIQRFGRALGAAPFAQDPHAAQLLHDLEVYIRQSHAEADDAALAREVLAADADQTEGPPA